MTPEHLIQISAAFALIILSVGICVAIWQRDKAGRRAQAAEDELHRLAMEFASARAKADPFSLRMLDEEDKQRIREAYAEHGGRP